MEEANAKKEITPQEVADGTTGDLEKSKAGFHKAQGEDGSVKGNISANEITRTKVNGKAESDGN